MSSTAQAIANAKKAPRSKNKEILDAQRKLKLHEIASRLERGADLRKAMKWPGGNIDIELEILSVADTGEAEAAAARAVAEAYSDVPSAEIRQVGLFLERTQAVELLYRAIREPGKPDRVFKSSEEFAGVATEGEIEALLVAYGDLKAEVDPQLVLSDEELQVIEDAIKKKDVTLLKDIASAMPKSSLLTLVDRLLDSLTDRSTPTH